MDQSPRQEISKEDDTLYIELHLVFIGLREQPTNGYKVPGRGLKVAFDCELDNSSRCPRIANNSVRSYV